MAARRRPASRAGDAAPDGGHAKVLAEVQSATVGQQVDLMLQTSDNYLAEVMGRMAALGAGRPGSSDDGHGRRAAAGRGHGHSHWRARAADVSGLALANRVSARQLTDVVRAMTSGTDTRLRAALAGFPVAGLTGTLGDRYTDAATAAGAGLVRAKTGTLNTVIALSGYVVDADGRLLVFSFVGNGLTPGAANKAALDRLRHRPRRLRLPLTALGRPGPRRRLAPRRLALRPAPDPAGSPVSEIKAHAGPCDLMELWSPLQARHATISPSLGPGRSRSTGSSPRPRPPA